MFSNSHLIGLSISQSVVYFYHAAKSSFESTAQEFVLTYYIYLLIINYISGV